MPIGEVLRPKATQCLLVFVLPCSVLFVLCWFVCFVGVLCLSVCCVCTLIEKRKVKSIGESMALHSSSLPLATELRLLQARAAFRCCCCGLVCLSVCLSACVCLLLCLFVLLFVLLLLAGFWVLQSTGSVWAGWRCAVSPGPPRHGSLCVGGAILADLGRS